MHALRKFVQDQMDARNWRAVDLVTRSGINKQVISGILTDDRDTVDRMPTEKTIAGLCKAFRIDRDVLLAVIGEAMGIPVSRPTVVYDASRVPSDELILELARRLREVGGEHVQRSAPITPAGGSPVVDNVRPFRRADERDDETGTTVPVQERAVANEDDTLEEEGIAQLEDP